MRQSKISVSMMCTNPADWEKLIPVFEQEGIEYLHMDVMDGSLVPNLGFGADDIRRLRKLTHIPLDLHLMIRSPESRLDEFDIGPADIVSIHCESTGKAAHILDRLKDYGCARFVVVNPSTPVRILEDKLDRIEGINLLTVSPGFVGQKMLPGALKKAKELQYFLQKRGREDIALEVDGNITVEHGVEFRRCGADIFVGGTSSVFCGDEKQYADNIRRLRAATR